MQFNRLALSLLAVLTTFARSKVDMACVNSGYCSQGKLTPFIGDLYTSARTLMQHCCWMESTHVKLLSQLTLDLNVAGSALLEALQARSYKKEVVIMVSDLKRLDSFLQAADSLQHLGLSNILLLSHTEAMCEKISLIVPSVGCAWSSHKHPADLAGNFYVWSLRYRILAR